MSVTRWVLALEPMPPRPGEPDPAVRVRRLLKFASRALRLRCVRAEGPPPDPGAYTGWLWLCGGWVMVCCHATEQGCRALLAERGPAADCRVLPRGEAPEQSAPGGPPPVTEG